ncbi:hypothetical protein LJK88_37320 [Paenibacillus sp. P26]|nr:hypothetical protein LJK88_37320 [Paenibacillus sp. P26]
MLTSQPTLYELPVSIGGMPAGTILLSALAKVGKQAATPILTYTRATMRVTPGHTYLRLRKEDNL